MEPAIAGLPIDQGDIKNGLPPSNESELVLSPAEVARANAEQAMHDFSQAIGIDLLGDLISKERSGNNDEGTIQTLQKYMNVFIAVSKLAASREPSDRTLDALVREITFLQDPSAGGKNVELP